MTMVTKRDGGAVLAAALFAVLCAGCPAMLITKGATTAAGIIADDRSLAQQAADEQLKGQIVSGLLSQSASLAGSVNVDVFNGRVLLTGVVGDEAARRTAARIARETAAGSEVYDDIEIGTGGLSNAAEDAVINKALGVNLLAGEGVASQSLLHRVVNGTAFIIGEVRNQSQVETVRSVALQTSGVNRVVTHLTIERQ